MRKNILFIVFVFVFIGCGLSEKAEPEKSVIIVKPVKLSGQVTLTRDKTVSVLTVGKALKEGDWITTKSFSTASIQVGGKTLIHLRPDSHVGLDELVAKSEKQAEKINFNLIKGSSLLKIKKLAKDDSNISVKTPTVVAAVRGTEFFIDSSTDKKHQIRVKSGKVAVKRNLVKEKGQKLPEALEKMVEEEAMILGAGESVEVDVGETKAMQEEVIKITSATEEEILEKVKDLAQKVEIKSEEKKEISQEELKIFEEVKDLEIVEEAELEELKDAPKVEEEAKVEVTGTLDLSFSPRSAKVVIVKGANKATRLIGGENELLPGSYSVNVSNPGYVSKSFAFDIVAGKVTAFEMSLHKKVEVSEVIHLLDGSSIKGKVVETGDKYKIMTDQGMREVDGIEVKNIEYIK